MSEEIKFSVPRWVLDEKRPHDSKQKVRVKVQDTNGNGKWDKEDKVSINGKSYEDDPETEINETYASNCGLMRLLGVKEGRASLQGAERYFGRLNKVANLAARGMVDGTQAHDLLVSAKPGGSDASAESRGIDTHKTAFRVHQATYEAKSAKYLLSVQLENLEKKAKYPDKKFWAEANAIRGGLKFYGMHVENDALNMLETFARRNEQRIDEEFAAL